MTAHFAGFLPLPFFFGLLDANCGAIVSRTQLLKERSNFVSDIVSLW